MNEQKTDFASERRRTIPFMGKSLCKDTLVEGWVNRKQREEKL